MVLLECRERPVHGTFARRGGRQLKKISGPIPDGAPYPFRVGSKRRARLLNLKPLAFCGILSYSLYGWQQIFLNRDSGAWINAFPQNLVPAIGAALASYFILEKTLVSFRRRLHSTATFGQAYGGAVPEHAAPLPPSHL